MKIERINDDKYKISVPFQELMELGISKEKIEKDSLEWQQLFYALIEKMNNELKGNTNNTIYVDLFTLQTDEVILIVTFVDDEYFYLDDEEEWVEQKEQIFYFANIEDVIQLALRICPFMKEGKLFYYQGDYYLQLELEGIANYENLLPLIKEYGGVANLTVQTLEEYGKVIFPQLAISQINQYFNNEKVSP